ncbi:MAG: PIN domain-containing protein [Thermostichus sp. DG02_5_bins_236]
MAEIPPLLIFDSPVILAGRPALWQEWGRFGICVLPRAVMTELERLTRQAIEPQEESVAREFLRQWPNLGFQVSEASALVGGIPPAGQSIASAVPSTLSQRARLEEAIAECAYALAQQQPGTLVVLVSNDRPLVGRVQALGHSNLCSISLAELNQWIRTSQRPRAVVAALNRLPGPAIPASTLVSPSAPTQVASARPPAAAKPQSQVKPSQAAAVAPVNSTAAHFWRMLKTLQNGITLLLALTLLSGAGLLAWRLADPEGSESIWRRLPLSGIPWLRDL